MSNWIAILASLMLRSKLTQGKTADRDKARENGKRETGEGRKQGSSMRRRTNGMAGLCASAVSAPNPVPG